MRIETDRLILRVAEFTDADAIVDGIGNVGVSRYLLRAPFPYSKGDAIQAITKMREAWSQEKADSRSFLIELKSENRIIGGIGIFEIDWDLGSAQCGFWLAKPYWRRGFMSEAIPAINDWAFGELNLQRIEAHVFVGNAASNAVLHKFCYRLVGTLRKAHRCRATGLVHDTNIHEMLKDDWLEMKRTRVEAS